MTISNPHRLFDENRQLKSGKLVTVFWTRGGFNYRGRGKIVALQSGTVTVRLLDKINHGVGYAAGSLVTVPRITDAANWSSHNCVQLLPHGKSSKMTRLAG